MSATSRPGASASGTFRTRHSWPTYRFTRTRPRADVAEVRVRHLARPVHDAAHHRDLEPAQVSGDPLHARGRLLEIEQRPAARGTGDELGPRGAQPRALEDAVGELDVARERAEAAERDEVADAVAERRAEIDGDAEQRRLGVFEGIDARAQSDR